MNALEENIIVIFVVLSLIVFIKGLQQSIKKKNPYGATSYFSWLGIFVWGDAIILGPFWFLSSLASYLLKNWFLFLLIISVFWVVRSLGETIYWLNQQFSKTHSHYYEKLTGYRFFKSDAILFIYQVFWQCIFIFSIIFSVYFCKMWLGSI